MPESDLLGALRYPENPDTSFLRNRVPKAIIDIVFEPYKSLRIMYLDSLGYINPSGSKYPTIRYLLKTRITIPNIDSLDTL